MTKQCKAKTDYVKEKQCSRQAKVKIGGVGLPDAPNYALHKALKEIDKH